MKAVVAGLFVLGSSVCFAGDISVVNHGTPPAAAVQETAPAASQAASGPANADCACKCTNRRARLYNVEESCTETCRNRLFGGYVRKNVARTVYRPTRR